MFLPVAIVPFSAGEKMVLKLVDRYVSRSFLQYFAGSVFLIAALYTTFDLLTRLDDIQDISPGQALSALAPYYARLVPVFLFDIVPALVLVAAGMVLVRMAKARELLALKASGTSVRRVIAPILLLALLISVAVFALRETLGPDLLREGQLVGRRVEDKVEKELLLSDSGFKAYVGEYDFERSTMTAVSLLELYPDGKLKRLTEADSGGWLSDGSIFLEGVTVQEFDPSGTAMEPVSFPSRKIETNLTPYDMIRAAEEGSDPSVLFRTLPDLWRQTKQSPGIPYFRVVFHQRLASFFSPIILLLVGIPCLVGFEHSVNSRSVGVILSIVVASALYALNFIFSSMGTTDTIHPVLAGWMPTAIVGGVGVWLYGSLRT